MIEVTHDQEPKWMTAERCCFCRTPTRYWHTPKDVAVCPSCSTQHSESEVPSKRDWINANRKPSQSLLPEGWQCHADRRAAELLPSAEKSGSQERAA